MLKKLLTTPTAQLGRAGRFGVFQIKLWSHCARLLKFNRAGQQAAALSYHTIFGIVPLAIVMLLIFQSFPTSSKVGEKIKNFVYSELNLSTIEYEPYQEQQTASEQLPERIKLTDTIDKIVSGFFSGANTGAVTAFSVLIVIWAAIALLWTIERAFNNIWHVARGRTFVQRLINCWALLTLGPLLLAVSLYLTTKYSLLGELQQTLVSMAAPAVVSYIIAVVAFFLLYLILPNTKVRVKPAIWGAAVGALVWVIAKNLFGYYVTEWKPYGTIYGVMALVPVTVMWIYITWLIVLFGLQLTFTTQHLKSLDAAEIASAKKIEDHFIANDITAISLVREIAAAFENNQPPISPEELCGRVDLPGELGDKLLQHLVDSRIIVKVSEPSAGFVPAKDPEQILLSDISLAVASASFGQSAIEGDKYLQEITRVQRDSLGRYNLKQILDVGAG